MSKDRQSRTGGRDSRTGRFVPLRESERRPETTQRERIPLPGYGDTGRSDKDKKRKAGYLVALVIAAGPVTAYTWPNVDVPNDLECVGAGSKCSHQPKIETTQNSTSAGSISL